MTTGGTELLVVLALAVLLFGPKKLPDLARSLGQAVGEYHRAQREFETEVRKTTSSIDKEVSSVTSAEVKPPQQGPYHPKTASAPKKPVTPPKPGTPIKQSGSKEVKEIAQNLGIDTTDKTQAQILKEISLKTKKKETKKG